MHKLQSLSSTHIKLQSGYEVRFYFNWFIFTNRAEKELDEDKTRNQKKKKKQKKAKKKKQQCKAEWTCLLCICLYIEPNVQQPSFRLNCILKL